MNLQTADFRRPYECPHCGRKLEAATGVSSAPAKITGALSICLYCGGVAVFVSDDGNMRAAAPSEIAAAEEVPMFRAAARAVAIYQQFQKARFN